MTASGRGVFRTPALRSPYVVAGLLGLGGDWCAAQSPRGHTTAEIFLGSAWSVPLPLTIRLPHQRTAVLARYATRPFADAPYYAVRAGGGTGAHALEAELVHHKLYLRSPQPPVEHFEVTHGYNLAVGNAVVPSAGWQLRIGFGLVVAHPEGRIAGRAVGRRAGRSRTLLGGGYHVAGATTQLALGRRYALGGGATVLTATPELKLTAAFARVPLEDGDVTAPNVALHALAGLGVRHRY